MKRHLCFSAQKKKKQFHPSAKLGIHPTSGFVYKYQRHKGHVESCRVYADVTKCELNRVE